MWQITDKTHQQDWFNFRISPALLKHWTSLFRVGSKFGMDKKYKNRPVSILTLQFMLSD